ncbi:MAG: hypothetical protein WC467_04025 [Patescibacteria group bacterium]
MKQIIISLLTVFAIFLCQISWAQTKVSTETTLCHDEFQTGVPLNRLEISNPSFSFKYDYKVDLINNTRVNDVLGIFLPKLIDQKTFSFGAGLIKLGDGDRSDNILVDLSAQKKFKAITIDLEIGRAFSIESNPWDYILSRASHKLFTFEGGILSSAPLFAGSKNKLYGWIAFHPEHLFVAVGNEISRDWAVFGTKGFKNFGSLSVADYDRKNGNFWFRSQFGFMDVNQKFYNQENYIISTSYLIVPPFFYKHFSPISTKGKYTLKFDGRRTNGFDVYEVSTGRQFGKYGQVAVGCTNENFNKCRTGLLLEYYKEFTLKNFKASTELRYEQLSKKFYGFIVLSYLIN